MKRMLCLLLATLLLILSLAGCGQTAAPEPAEGGWDLTAENEIFTYEKIDPERTQLIVAKIGNIAIEPFLRAFEADNPDIQIILIDITGGGGTGVQPLIGWLKSGCAPDVVFSASNSFDAADVEQLFENLSAEAFLKNYEAEALTRTAVNANVYWLPGPSNVNAMMYNKTLFAQYGWEVPVTFDEFVALCVQIREDTNGAVQPWNPNAKYANEIQSAMEAFVYEEVFGGADNRAWYNDFIEGKATFAGHMDPYYAAVQALVENGILLEEHFSYSATTRGKELREGKIAMTNMVIADYDNETYDFGLMPFPTTKGELGYICDTYSCYVGVPKKEQSEKAEDAVDRFLAFFSSPEGQEVFIDNTMMVSNVKGVSLNQSDDLAALQPAVDAGHMFARLDFISELGERAFSLNGDARDIIAGAKTAEECIAAVDAGPFRSPEQSAQAKGEVIAAASEDMTILETSFYIADAYREKTGADIALIANNIAYRGNLMRIFAGEIADDFITVLKPRSLENGSTLVKVSMTGAQLMEALDVPPDYGDGIANCTYAFSGLKCEVAPWNAQGERYLSVTLADGTAVDPAQRYTVAFWGGTVAEAYIGEVLETYEDSFEDIMREKMRADGTVAAADDGRIRLVWE